MTDRDATAKPAPDAASSRLGTQLRDVRTLRGDSLRSVAAGTGISAAYLLKLEQGQVTTPSPHVLLNLAKHYDVSYLGLMALAGYATGDDPDPMPARTGVLAEALAAQDLTPEEERAMAAFLSSLRAR
ncbi:MAG TPA: helix-turn-helix domain-containing protein [Mycobacteriales bacterium]|nr:helix-turn-helix domain-containing protein [Mycobacteriales bacterium]